MDEIFEFLAVPRSYTPLVRSLTGAVMSLFSPPPLYYGSPITVQVKTGMAETKNNFWMGTLAGAVIIIILDLLVPFFGPIIGGFVAGYIADRDIMNAGKAGLIAGILAGIVVSLVVFAGLVSHPLSGYVPAAGTGFFLMVTIILYLAILAFLGGAIAGAVRK
ncbi:MAG: DUF5518 domain-containing protein [Methanomicrobiales archaeon]|jgi:hypothetical protein|nr:DUF5518 domain-containing protein [Methanoregulaceae archaeon]